MDQTVLKLQDCNENAEESAENSQQQPKKFVSKTCYGRVKKI